MPPRRVTWSVSEDRLATLLRALSHQEVAGQGSVGATEPPWMKVDRVEWAASSSIDWFDNGRNHKEIGKISPAELEENCYRQNQRAELVNPQTKESHNARSESGGRIRSDLCKR
jgi:hypothetical protein